jgi:hypothetical protein
VHYLIADRTASDHMPAGWRLVVDGEMISFEGPWTFGVPLIAHAERSAQIGALTSGVSAPPGCNAFAVEGIEAPGSGQAFVLGCHMHA